MRIVRLAALLGSLILLVATSVSLINRRGDVRDEQVARVELGSQVAWDSVRGTLAQVSDQVELSALAVASSTDVDGRALANQLVRDLPDSEACVVRGQSSECTGADLLSLESVSDLAVLSASGDDAGSAAIGVEPGSDDEPGTVLVVQRFSDVDSNSTVAMRVPVDQLLSESSQRVIVDVDAEVDVVARSREAADSRGLVETQDDRRVVVDLIGSAFADGSIENTSSVEGDVGVAGNQTTRYITLLALGTILLALAGWTFLVERRSLERRATTDELTQLINRREFERVSEEALDIADRFNTGLCVMVIDLNGFKQINDRLGHQYGDLVLTAASERFVDAVRDTDVVGRWGGDEFVILLPGLSERTAVRNSAERIWNRLASSPVVGDTTITASIGAAIFPRHGTTLDGLMRAADVAMYEAKTTGVSHRIADTITVGESLLTPDGEFEPLPSADVESPEVVTDEYAGPDRRRSPVPPPPSPLQESEPESESESDPATDDEGGLAPPSGTRSDEPSVR
jgi:diguanylate cyclase (GGDEF)-like protein